MPAQKTIQVDPGNPTEITNLFSLGYDLAQDGWGVTIVANERNAFLNTNAPMNIINFHTSKVSA
jgi:hypothetical protein